MPPSAVQCILAASLGLLASFPSVAAQTGGWQDYQANNRTPSSCPDYSTYSKQPHEPYSSGRLKLPYMRPSEDCRTFTSPAVEKVISDIKSRLKDADLARLFENTFPSTLDTTVKYFDPKLNLAFIITGDITAQWLRDTGNQFAHLYKLLPQDKDLQTLVKAVINTEARYISQYPYCGSFQPPPESGLAPSHNDWADKVNVNPPVNNQTVFECKYELDSLAGFLKIVRSYYANTKDSSFINDNWNAAMSQIVRVIQEQSQGSWSNDWEFVSYYNWTGTPGALSPAVPNSGNGEPKLANGLVASSHRPSDDLCVFNFITSDNAMMSVELANIADMLDKIGTQKNLSRQLRQFSRTIRDAVLAHTVASNGIFAYETNGYGGMYIMDDANVPSLVSLPYLGFLDRDDATYVKTKQAMFSKANPYYAKGKSFDGIGGPHVNATYPWPMSQISAIFGTDDDREIQQRLAIILENTSGLGLIHESIHIYDTQDFSRPWFAWANSYFAEMILDLAERKPGLIFKTNAPYIIGGKNK
ncbi:Meiotically up-regulated gene protein [Cladobotryum mycophilum]|uniref:Meiotically up-regulated gene protein n=1 Tax=Cladobotryum mycophilum TaxID=491253 RepID=A0ABR0SJN5_9HYPO